MADRRRSKRYIPNQEVYARIKSSIPVRIMDVSKNGMRVESTSALPPAGECDLWIPGDDGDVRLRIRVQRCRARFVKGEDGSKGGLVYQAGLEFTKMNASARFALVSIVQSLEGDLGDADALAAEVASNPGNGDSDDGTDVDISKVS